MKYFFSATIMFFSLLSALANGQNVKIHPFVNNRDILLISNLNAQIHQANLSKGEVESQLLANVMQKNKSKASLKLKSRLYYPATAIINDTLRNSYAYDNNGNLLTELQEILNNNVWTNYCRFNYTYDNNGDELTYIYQTWTNNAWMNVFKETFSYNSSGKILTDFSEGLVNNTWTNLWTDTTTYDVNNRMLTSMFEHYENNVWTNGQRDTYTYDNNGNIHTDIIEIKTTDIWVNNARYTATYDNNKRVGMLGESWTNNSWLNNSSDTWTYDSSGNMLTNFEETWADSVWTNKYRETYTYDNNGNELTSLGEYWANNAWLNNGKETYTYNSYRNELTYLYETWTNNAWINNLAYSYTYNDYNEVLSFLSQEGWANNTWQGQTKVNYTYDGNGNAITGEVFTCANNVWQKAQGNYSINLEYNSGADNLNLTGIKISVTYNLNVDDINRDQPALTSYNLYQNYPNPFNPSTIIRYQIPKPGLVQLKVYDILGRDAATLVNEYQTAGEHSVQFSADDKQQTTNHRQFSSGVYFSLLRSGDYISIKKMVLLK